MSNTNQNQSLYCVHCGQTHLPTDMDMAIVGKAKDSKELCMVTRFTSINSDNDLLDFVDLFLVDNLVEKDAVIS